MRYILSLVVMFGLVLCAIAQKEGTVSKGQEFSIKKLAILPFSVSPDTNRLLNGVTAESILRSSRMSRYRFQRYLYIWFTKHPKKYNVTFQEFMKTNDLLKQAGILDSAEKKSKEQLCSLLGVDAVIYGDMRLVKPMSKESSDVINGIIGLPVASSNKVRLELFIYESTGNLKWKRMYQEQGNHGDEGIIERLMRRVSKTFPF